MVFLLGCWGMWGEEGRKEGRGDGQKNSGSILSYLSGAACVSLS